MFDSRKEKKRKATRERVKRYREKQKAVISNITPIEDTVTGIIPCVTNTKMLCKCQYFKMYNGQLVCTECGKPPPARKANDGIRRGVVW